MIHFLLKSRWEMEKYTRFLGKPQQQYLQKDPDVHYVPNLSQNLLSVGQLIKRGYQLNFDNGECAIIDKKWNIIIAKVKMTQNNFFPLRHHCLKK